jgi:membrane fusion protein, copper/silver efflux system
MNANDETTPRGGESPRPAGAAPPSSVHQPPPGAHFMNILRWVLFAFLLVLAVISIGSYAMSKRPASATEQAATKVIWQCPMHPSYTSDKPGDCPICGMTLVAIQPNDSAARSGPRRIVYYRNPMNPSATSPVPMKDEMGMDYLPVYSDEGASGSGQQGDVPGLTSVDITPERIQLIGVRTARVERSATSGQLDLVGFITPDETRLRRVQIRVSGWIRQLYVNETGVRVSAGQPLMSIYSPELFQSEQEYLISRGGLDHTMDSTHVMPGQPGAERLRLLGVPDEEIRRLEGEGKASTQLVLRSPVTGTVLERGVVEGQYVGADTPLLTVADLSRVWVMADLYEMDMTRVHVGDPALFTTDAMPGRTFEGRVQFVYPTISSETRTLKTRLALSNTDGALRPGLYGRVRVSARGARTLSVPSEAVVNAGQHSYVFVAHRGGHFEPRMVWTGMPQGDRVQILKGVVEGDTVVASASFLIDSESRLKAAIAGKGSQASTPDAAGVDHPVGGVK